MRGHYGSLKFAAGPVDGTIMEKTGKPSVEHIVLGAVLLVVLAVGGWFLLKPGGSAKPTSAAVEPATSRPTDAAKANEPQYATPGHSLKPTKFALVPMTKAAYLKAGNKICARMNAESKALGDFPSDTKEQAAYVTKAFVINERARKLLVALPAPANAAAKLASYYVVMAKADGIGKSLVTALNAGDTTKATALEKELAKVSAKGNAEFNAYGLTTCGS